MSTVYLDQPGTFNGDVGSFVPANWITALLSRSDGYTRKLVSPTLAVLQSSGKYGYAGYTIELHPVTAFGISGTNGVNGYVASAELKNPSGVVVGSIEDIPYGLSLSSFDDFFTLFDSDSAIIGSNGADTITSFNTYTGGFYIDGGAGDDTLNGGKAPDFDMISETFVGGPGNDKIYARGGDDVIYDGDGVDYIDAGDGDDVVLLLDSSHSIDVYLDQTAAAGATRVDNAELVAMSDFGSRVYGGSRADLILGGEGVDEIHGGVGADVIAGLGGNDRLYGDSGDDLFDPGEGDDYVDGGDGVDLVDLSAASGAVTVDLGNTNPQQTGQGLDTFVNIESVNGTDFADTLTGNAGANTLTGGGGNDTLDGAGGADTLIGGAGGDIYKVDNVNDVIVEAPGEGVDAVMASVTYTLPAEVEFLTLFGAINGYGNELGNNIRGSADGNWIEGRGGDDQLFGLDGGDVLLGGDGSDALDGGQGADTLDGGRLFDVLVGGAGADTLIGGTGNDRFQGILADFAGDTIVDLSAGDQIRITDANLATFTMNRQGATVTLTGGVTFTLANDPKGTLVATADPNGGVRIKLQLPETAPKDVNGDGHSDFIWRHTSGYVTAWMVGGDGAGIGFKANTYAYDVSNDWKLETTLDFNGDGAADLLWRHLNGTFTIWTGAGEGFMGNAFVNSEVGVDWKLQAVGDFDGDGKDDLIWRHANGAFTEWRSTGTDFERNFVVSTMAPNFKVAAVGDFNGDGVDDILWRDTATGLAQATTSRGDAFAPASMQVANVGPDWALAGHGDFNGDGKEDIIWRAANGTFTEWQSTGSSWLTNVYVNSTVDPAWKLADVADYNADGKDDLMWRHANGTFTLWQSTGDGFAANVLVNSSVSADWGLVV